MQMRTHLQHNISHELRTPMAAIRGYARMIVDGRAGDINSTQKDYLTVITENTNRLIGLVSWMSHVADLTSQNLKVDGFDIREVWRDSLRSQEAVLRAKSIKIKEQIPEEPFEMIGDRQRLFQAVSSLIGVAAGFANENGTITVELSHGREQEIVVKISDNGACVPAEVLNKLTERRHTTESPTSGSDSGLSELHDVIGIHGGRVFVNSKAGQGSTYIFTLPAVSYDSEGILNEQAVNSSSR
jgi:signal transduction histidine kinase